MEFATSPAAHTSPRTLARRPALLAALVLGLASLTGCSGGDPAPSRTGLFVSDFHFNPLDDASLAAQLTAAPVAQWDAIFLGSSKSAYASFGTDPNYLLLQSALDAMQAKAPSPDIIFISGDLLAHRLDQHLYPTALPSSTPAEAAAFAQKTEQYLAFKLTQTFPNAQIVATMGDWDSDVDIHSFPSAAFISSFAATWGPAANRLGGAPTIGATFPTGGYYSTAFPVDPKGRLLVLYTQAWANECTTGCGTDAGSPGAAEFTWLTAQLAEARTLGQRVWLLGHIPPGFGATPTAEAFTGATTCAAALAPFYADAYATQLQALYLEYRDVLAFGVFGHEHFDDYRLVRDADGEPVLGMKLMPGIAPPAGNNPAFVWFSYDPAEGVVTSATTIALTNLPVASKTVPGLWTEEYQFNQAYGQSALDTNGLADAVTRIQTTAAGQSSFKTYMPSSSAVGAPQPWPDFKVYACSFDQLTAADFTACYCGG